MKLITESVSYFHVCEQQTGISWTGLFTVDLKWVWQDGLSPLVPQIPNKKIKCSFMSALRGFQATVGFVFIIQNFLKWCGYSSVNPLAPLHSESYEPRDLFVSKAQKKSMTLNF